MKFSIIVPNPDIASNRANNIGERSTANDNSTNSGGKVPTLPPPSGCNAPHEETMFWIYASKLDQKDPGIPRSWITDPKGLKKKLEEFRSWQTLGSVHSSRATVLQDFPEVFAPFFKHGFGELIRPDLLDSLLTPGAPIPESLMPVLLHGIADMLGKSIHVADVGLANDLPPKEGILKDVLRVYQQGEDEEARFWATDNGPTPPNVSSDPDGSSIFRALIADAQGLRDDKVRQEDINRFRQDIYEHFCHNHGPYQEAFAKAYGEQKEVDDEYSSRPQPEPGLKQKATAVIFSGLALGAQFEPVLRLKAQRMLEGQQVTGPQTTTVAQGRTAIFEQRLQEARAYEQQHQEPQPAAQTPNEQSKGWQEAATEVAKTALVAGATMALTGNPVIAAGAAVLSQIGTAGTAQPVENVVDAQTDEAGDDDVTIETEHEPGEMQGEHTGPKATYSDYIDFKHAIIDNASASARQRRELAPSDATAQTNELFSVPLETVHANETVFRNDFEAYSRLNAPAPRDPVQLQRDAQTLLDQHIADTEAEVQRLHVQRGSGELPPPFQGSNATDASSLAAKLDRLLELEVLKLRYTTTPSNHHHRHRNARLHVLTHQQTHGAAKALLQTLQADWKLKTAGDDSFILSLLGKSPAQWFREHKDQLNGKTCAQAKAAMLASCAGELPVGEQGKLAFTLALIDQLDPTLRQVPESVLEQMQWADDRHLNYRVGYAALSAANIPIRSEKEMDAAAQTIITQFMNDDLGALGQHHMASDFALLTGAYGAEGKSDDTVLADIMKDFEQRPNAVRDQKLAQIRAALVDPPPSLAEIAAVFGEQYISGRPESVTTVKYPVRPVSFDNRVVRNETLLDAFAHGNHYSRGSDGNSYRQRTFLIEVPHGGLAAQGQEVTIDGERIFAEYDQRARDYFKTVERGAHAQLDLLFGLHRQPEAILKPQVQMGSHTVKSPDNIMIVMLRSDGANQPQPYRLAFDAGRHASLTPMAASIEDIADHDLNTVEDQAMFYVKNHPAEFFERAPDQIRSGTFGIERRFPGTPHEVRREVFSQLGWTQKLEAHKLNAERSLHAKPYVEGLPLYGCVNRVRDAFTDPRVQNEPYEYPVGARPPRTTPSSSYVNPFPTDEFIIGLQCGGAVVSMLGGKRTLMNKAAKWGKAVGNLHGVKFKSLKRPRKVFVDALMKGKNEFRDRLRAHGLSTADSNDLSAKLNSVGYGHAFQRFRDAKELEALAKLTTDGSRLRDGADLPHGMLITGSDGKRYLKASGGQEGGIFFDPDRRKFMRQIGAADAPRFAEVDLHTLTLRPGSSGYRQREPDAVAIDRLGQAKTSYYGDGTDVRVLDGPGLRRARPNEGEAYRNSDTVLKRDTRRHADGIIRYVEDGAPTSEKTHYRLTQPDGSDVVTPPAGSIHSYKVPMLRAIGPEGDVLPFRWERVAAFSIGSKEILVVKIDGALYHLKNKEGRLHAVHASPHTVQAYNEISCAPRIGNARTKRAPGQQLRRLCDAGAYDKAQLVEELQRQKAASTDEKERTEIQRNINHLEQHHIQRGTDAEFAELDQLVKERYNSVKTGINCQEIFNVENPSELVKVGRNKVKGRNVAAFTMNAFDGESTLDSATVQGVTAQPRILISGSYAFKDQLDLLPGAGNHAGAVSNLGAMNAAGRPREGQQPIVIPRDGDTEYKALPNIEANMRKFMDSVASLDSASVNNPEKKLRMDIKFHTGLPPCLSCSFAMDEYMHGLKEKVAKWNLENRGPGRNGIQIDVSFKYGFDPTKTE
ncbi:hypothetical protein [Pseudoduganella sp. R-43]|uniref:hypothetical protein n=1 Tax=Pseudoduganella sp. R-43 TaxID=3404063 RepID=UPI003CEBD1AE